MATPYCGNSGIGSASNNSYQSGLRSSSVNVQNLRNARLANRSFGSAAVNFNAQNSRACQNAAFQGAVNSHSNSYGGGSYGSYNNESCGCGGGGSGVVNVGCGGEPEMIVKNACPPAVRNCPPPNLYARGYETKVNSDCCPKPECVPTVKNCPPPDRYVEGHSVNINSDCCCVDGEDGKDGAQGPTGPTGKDGPVGPRGPSSIMVPFSMMNEVVFNVDLDEYYSDNGLCLTFGNYASAPITRVPALTGPSEPQDTKNVIANGDVKGVFFVEIKRRVTGISIETVGKIFEDSRDLKMCISLFEADDENSDFKEILYRPYKPWPVFPNTTPPPPSVSFIDVRTEGMLQITPSLGFTLTPDKRYSLVAYLYRDEEDEAPYPNAKVEVRLSATLALAPQLNP